MTKKIEHSRLNNGMTIIAEPMDVASVAFGIMLPCGTARIEEGCAGAGNVITDWVMRGAGEFSSRELMDKLDSLGLHRGSSVGTYKMTLSSSMEASCLESAIQLYADIIQHPTLDAEQFELSKQLALHELAGLDDNPNQKVMLKLRELFYAPPLGKPAIGYQQDLSNLTAEKTREIIKENFNLSDAIITIAGKYDFEKICDTISSLFDKPQAPFECNIKKGDRKLGYTHFDHDGSQVHIGLMVEVPPAKDKDYYNIMTAVSILSGGMSSRLFTEVREKRGLCYAIGANYNSLKDRAGISCYAGTTPDKAQETLEVTLAEFKKLSDGVSQDELDRAKIGLKSSLIMKSESSMSRAASLGGDFTLLGKVRSLNEIKEKIDAVTQDSVLEALQRCNFKDCCIVSIGPKEVNATGIL